MLRSRLLVIAAILLVLGMIELLVGLVRGEMIQLVAGDLASLLIGWGSFAEIFSALTHLTTLDQFVENLKLYGSPEALHLGTLHLGAGITMWIVGWAILVVTLRDPNAPRVDVGVLVRQLKDSVGTTLSALTLGVFRYKATPPQTKLHPRIATFVDFHWGTLLAYGFGFVISELVFIRLYTGIVGKGTVQGGAVVEGFSPVVAFLIAFAVASVIVFIGGFIGAANSKRLSMPEATLAVLYFGLPVPVFLTVMHTIPQLMIDFGGRLREVIYLSSLLGENRPELGYWLLTVQLLLTLVLGICFGFVSTSSGRLDLRASYELFIASRHVAVFRPRLLLEVFGVLILGIVPPLIIGLILAAADRVAEMTRIKKLGLANPVDAAEALHKQKLEAKTPTGMMTSLSVGGVGVGVMALIIVLSVMSGFEADLQKKILGTNSHGVVMKYAPEMPEYEEVLGKVKAVRGIKGATPFILNEVMISSEGNISGSMIKGIDPNTVGEVTDLPEYLLPGGKLEWLTDPKSISRGSRTDLDEPAFDPKPATPDEFKKPVQDLQKGPSDIERDPLLDLPTAEEEKAADVTLPGILMGRELAASLKVVVGDRLNVVSPIGGEMGPMGPMPKSRPFRVAGIFYSGMYEYDSKFVYIHLREAETFFNVKGATGIEVKVTDVDNARGTMKAVYDTLQGYPYRTKDWGEMNRNLFAALRLEKLVMGIILSIIVIVAAGLIVATVIMLVLEKRKEIAVLKALGVPDGGIVKIFLSEGLQIGVAGGILGLISGLAWCLFIEKVGIRLDPQVYYIPALPVRIEPFQTALSVVIAILVTFLASIYPALKASKVDPVDGLKSE